MDKFAAPRQDATPIGADAVKDHERLEALAILEQMYGYFSFDPMPLEADLRLAA